MGEGECEMDLQLRKDVGKYLVLIWPVVAFENNNTSSAPYHILEKSISSSNAPTTALELFCVVTSPIR